MALITLSHPRLESDNMPGYLGRPSFRELLRVLVINLFTSGFLLVLLFALLDVRSVLSAGIMSHVLLRPVTRSLGALPFVPGAAGLFGIFWYWMALVGRVRGVPWGAAVVYGIMIAVVNVPLAGFVRGLAMGNPLLGLLYALAMVLMLPSLLLCMTVFGICMGVLNGSLAASWIRSRRGR